MTVDRQQEVLKIKLSVEERARLAEWIASSLDVELEIARSWFAEVRRRDEELASGAVAPLPLGAALASVRSPFGW